MLGKLLTSSNCWFQSQRRPGREIRQVPDDKRPEVPLISFRKEGAEDEKRQGQCLLHGMSRTVRCCLIFSRVLKNHEFSFQREF